MRRLRILLLFLARAVAVPAGAEPQTILPTPQPGSHAKIVRVAVDRARAGALSEMHGLLAFCHDGANRDADLSLIRLDARGRPSPATTSWKLPPHKGLEKPGQYALSVAFHPKQPILYVWQDTNVNSAIPANINLPGVKDLPNLLVYRVDKSPPELVLGFRPSPVVLFGVQGGSLAVDPAGEFLLVPNIRDVKSFLRAGRYRLDADGLPLLDPADAKRPLAERLKTLTQRSAEKKAEPVQLTPVEYVYTFPANPWGLAHSVHLVERDVILIGSIRGIFSVRPGDPTLPAHHLPLPAASLTQLAGHPTLPVLYATRTDTDSLYRVEHVDGYLSLLPLRITLPELKLFSAPALLDGGKTLAVGGHYCVYLIELDGQGRPAGGVTEMRVLNPATRVLLSSPKFDCAYVAVEVSR